MDSTDFEDRLRELFEEGGIPYRRARDLFDRERDYSERALQYKGYLAVSDGFKSLFLETVELVNVQIKPKIVEPLPASYAMFIPRLAHAFASLCGAERVSIKGYPYLGYTSLRNVFDSLTMTSAAVQGLTDFYAIEGVNIEESKLDPSNVIKRRKRVEFEIRKKMTGANSGFSATTIEELRKWDMLFDYETHGGRLSLADSMAWMKGERNLPVVPTFNETTFALFINRYCEIAWMAHRLLPLAQPKSIPLSDQWREKWTVVDQSFRLIVESLTKQLAKKIGSVMVEFVEAKFPFSEQDRFPD